MVTSKSFTSRHCAAVERGARVAQLKVRELGDYIREQRRGAQISLRQLARLAGVSNPYLSQIERGLRKPSAEILQQIAKALRISAEALYVQAGILEEREGDSDVPSAVIRDPSITERQKHVLLEIYDSFRRENDSKSSSADAPDSPAASADAPGTAGRVAGTARRTTKSKPETAGTGPTARTPRRTKGKAAGDSTEAAG
jgi:transcriptional regulator with XRE-family HTH domain